MRRQSNDRRQVRVDKSHCYTEDGRQEWYWHEIECLFMRVQGAAASAAAARVGVARVFRQMQHHDGSSPVTRTWSPSLTSAASRGGESMPHKRMFVIVVIAHSHTRCIHTYRRVTQTHNRIDPDVPERKRCATVGIRHEVN